MFDYKYIVKANDGTEFGLFKSKAVAQILVDNLPSYGKIQYHIEEIK